MDPRYSGRTIATRHRHLAVCVKLSPNVFGQSGTELIFESRIAPAQPAAPSQELPETMENDQGRSLLVFGHLGNKTNARNQVILFISTSPEFVSEN